MVDEYVGCGGWSPGGAGWSAEGWSPGGAGWSAEVAPSEGWSPGGAGGPGLWLLDAGG